ncbi:hypothetical protein [Nocardia sp. CA-290969]|uniref:hypothetical protein n=1 Tax=Nocardia sp. CA-290969 TaxID=3239986 RepID=UPI003D8A55F6
MLIAENGYTIVIALHLLQELRAHRLDDGLGAVTEAGQESSDQRTGSPDSSNVRMTRTRWTVDWQ